MIFVVIIGLVIAVIIVQVVLGLSMNNKIDNALSNYVDKSSIFGSKENMFTKFIHVNRFSPHAYKDFRDITKNSQAYLSIFYKIYFPFRDEYIDKVKSLLNLNKNKKDMSMEIMNYFPLTTIESSFYSFQVWDFIRQDIDFYLELVRSNGYKKLDSANYDSIPENKKNRIYEFLKEPGRNFFDDYQAKLAIHELIVYIDNSIFCSYFKSKHQNGPLEIMSLEKVTNFVSNIADVHPKVAEQYVINKLEDSYHRIKHGY